MVRRHLLIIAILALLLSQVGRASAAPSVWTGPPVSFTKTAGTPQDSLTPNVALTRGSTQGMYNAVSETSFNSASPAGTEWATAVNNPSVTITATNWAALSFTDWTHAYGGPGNTLQSNITSKNAVVHLITDNIYLNLQFTNFTSGGAFAYQRSTPVPEPSTIALAGIALISLIAISQRGATRASP
jgi:PEP-CTERM motif